MGVLWILYFIESFVMCGMRGNDLALSDSIYIVFIIFDSIVALMMLSRFEKIFSSSAILGLMLRLFFLFWVEYCSDIFLMPNTGYDEIKFYWNGYSHLVTGASFTGYAGLVSILFDLFGASKLFGSFFNVICSIQTMVLFRAAMNMLGFSESAKKKAYIFLCLMPNYALSSSILLRESVIILFTALSFYYFTRWWTGLSNSNFIIAILSTLPAIYYHSGMIAVPAGYFCTILAMNNKKFGKSIQIFNLKTIVLMASAAIMGVMLMNRTGLEIAGAGSISDVVSMSEIRISGGSGYDANLFSNDSALGFVGNSPIHMLYFLLSPLPWQWRGIGDIIAFVMSALIYGWLFFKAIRVRGNGKNQSLIKAMILIVLFFMLIFGWGTSNSGTALRHRDKAIIYYSTIYACFAELKTGNSRKYYEEQEAYEI